MKALSYDERIRLGNQVPELGQFKVIEQIPQYQICEVHNLVPAPDETPATLKHVVFNSISNAASHYMKLSTSSTCALI